MAKIFLATGPSNQKLREPVTFLALCVSFALVGGCATYQPAVMPIPVPERMAAWRSEETVAIGADPYFDGERQKGVFNSSLLEYGVLTVLILVENRSDRRLEVHGSRIKLQTRDGPQLETIGAGQLVEKVWGVPDRLPRPVPADLNEVMLCLRAFLFCPVLLALHDAEIKYEERRIDRWKDYRAKALPTIVEPMGSIQGFIFFVLPKGADLEGALLDLEIVPDEANGFTVHIPLTERRPQM